MSVTACSVSLKSAHPPCNTSHLCIGYLSAAAANRPATPEVFKLIGSGYPSCYYCILSVCHYTPQFFVRQLNIKTAILNGELDPNLDLHCHQPEGFRVLGPDGTPLVCKLVKSLYGLKQALRAWSQLVKKVLTAHGCVMSRANPALYYRQDSSGGWTYVLTYVDDFIIALDNLALYTLLIKAMEAAG